jgi:hypothetical protein
LAYSSTIRRASSVREGLLGFLGPDEAGSSSCGFIEWKAMKRLRSTGPSPVTHGAPLFVVLKDGIIVQQTTRIKQHLPLIQINVA